MVYYCSQIDRFNLNFRNLNNEDEVWMSLKASGSRQAFSIIYERNFAVVYHCAKKMLDNSQEAEDVTSESFVKLWERFDGFSNLNAARSFLMTVTKNACLNRIKLNKNAREREALFATNLDSSVDSMGNEDITGHIYQYIFDEIEKLPPAEKKVFKLSYLEGKSNEEIALLLDITNQSVRNYKARALKSLRKVLQQRDVLTVFLLLIGIAK